MSLELVPKSELPEWGKADEKLKDEFEARMKSGNLHLISAENPEWKKLGKKL